VKDESIFSVADQPGNFGSTTPIHWEITLGRSRTERVAKPLESFSNYPRGSECERRTKNRGVTQG